MTRCDCKYPMAINGTCDYCKGGLWEDDSDAFTGYDERCPNCTAFHDHSWNEHYRAIHTA